MGLRGPGIFPAVLLTAQREGLAIDTIVRSHRKLPCAASGDADDG
jgi:hypothetical protein